MARSKRGTVVENRFAPYEAKFDERGLSYTYNAMVPIESITRYADAQARQRLAGSAVVRQYAEKMKAGEVFPPVTLAEFPEYPDEYVLLDGNTRLPAHQKRGHTHVDAYIITGLHTMDDAVYLSGLLNGMAGQPLDKAEVLRAVRAGKSMDPPMTDAAIAKDLGVPPSRVSRLMAAERFDERAKALDLPTTLTENHKVNLAKIDLDPVFSALTRLVTDADLPVQATRDLVTKVQAESSEPERIKVIQQERGELANVIGAIAAGRAAIVPPSRDGMMALGRLNALAEKYPNPADWVPASEDLRSDWAPKIKGLIDFLGSVHAAYGQ